MKPLLLCAALLPLLFTACKKDKEEPPNRDSNKITATVQVAGATPLSFSVTGAAAETRPVYPGASAYHLYAKDPANRTLFIYLPEVKAAGTFPLTGNAPSGSTGAVLEYNSNLNGNGLDNIYYTTNPAVTSKGSVTVTVFTGRRMEGVFTARAKNLSGEEVVITDGSFSCAW